MKNMRIQSSAAFVILALSMFGLQMSCAFGQGTAFTYQGRLNAGAVVANGSYDLQFSLYAAGTGGSVYAGPVTNTAVAVTNGLFTTVVNFGSGVFVGTSNWLQIAVSTNSANAFATLSPRQLLTPVPYSAFANTASNLSGLLPAAQLNGAIANANLPASPNFSGTVSAAGFSGSGTSLTALNASNLASGTVSTSVLPGFQGAQNAIGGGSGNVVNGTISVIGGGQGNTVSANQSAIVGGSGNLIQAGAYYSLIGSGGGNLIQTNSYDSVIGGGYHNTVLSNSVVSVINGGQFNLIGSNVSFAVIGGGLQNTNLGNYAVAGGGYNNFNSGSYSVVAGGYNNTNNGIYNVVGGGYGNGASGSASTVAGGNLNQATNTYSTVGGGNSNLAGGRGATVAGGVYNSATTNWATIGGGANNSAGGLYATIPGGYQNMATGPYSFAAGLVAQATNQGAFVWADSQGGPFLSTNNDSFNVRAQGGVNLVTSGAGLQVDGSQVMTAAPGSIPASQINDGGAGAYATFQQTEQTLGGDTTVGFTALSPVTATNSSAPAFTLTVAGAAFGSVIGFSGHEALSQPYSFVVEVTNATSLGTLNTEVGKAASLTFSRNGRTTTYSGIVLACAQASTAPSCYLYTVEIGPVMAEMALNTDYQIYQDKDVPDLASEVYQADVGATPEENLSDSYSVHTSLTQYGESDLNFFNRILENEGIYYYFDQGVTPPALSLASGITAYQTGANSPFNFYGNNSTNFQTGEEYIRTFQQTSREVTQRATIGAYDFTDPLANLLESAIGAAPDSGEYFEYGNSVQTAAYDTQLAGVRSDIQTMAQTAIAGTGTAPDLRPGYTFALTDQSGSGLGGTYLVTGVHHAGFVRVVNGVNTWFYGNEFQVVPASERYRPPLVTPKPKAFADTAKVTGAAGNEIDLDKYGRITVLFHWDRHDQANNTSSARVRVANPWAGPGYGAYFWPRIGNEVMISYIDGDPDQPVVTGSLFNGDNLPPYSLPANQTTFGIKTLSSKGGGGFNELRFDDTKNSEEIYMHAQKDWNIDVLNNLTLNVNNNLTIDEVNTMSVQATAMNLNSGAITATGNLTVDGTFFGDGSGLTNLNASQLTAGTVPNNVLSSFQAPLFATAGGGYSNNASGTESTVSGGNMNQATNTYATVGGGNNNFVGGRGATVAGGVYNSVTNSWATIGGGANNGVAGLYATIPGGYLNLAAGEFSFAAGFQAQAMNQGAFVWADSQSTPFSSANNDSFNVRAQGGVAFVTSGAGMTIDGQPVLTGSTALNGGGLMDLNASALSSGTVPTSVLPGFQGGDNAIGGGSGNTISGTISVIAGGQNNTVSANQSAIVGGSGNVIQTGSYYSLIGSGGGNLIQSNSYDGVIGGGYHNLIASNSVVATVGGGQFNTVATNVSFTVIGGGYGNTNAGAYATIPGGYQNLATGQYGFAAGANAQATNSAAFVWGDGSIVTGSFANNSVTMRAINGFRFYSSTSSGTYAYLAPGSGSWTSLSDRNAKEHFATIDSQEVLARVSALPVTTWNYKTQPADVRHIGPTAQDFKAAFAVGESDTGISVVDEGGVALAAIQGLNQKVESENATLRAENADLKARLEKLEQLVSQKLGGGQ